MKTKYSISKHRFYELKHFCLQYPEWEALYSTLDGWPEEIGKNEGDTTSKDGIRRADLARKMELVKGTADDACDGYAKEIFEYVILGDSGRHSPEFWYYYQKFFYELSRRRE